MEAGRIVETTVPFERYYGVVFTPAEATKFVMVSLMLELPGFGEAFGRAG